MTQRIAFALTLAALSGGLLAAQQQPAPQTPAPPADQPPVTFRVEVNYVEVDAVVTDAQGTPISNLTKDDFEIFEDGKKQDVSTFSLVNIPIERAERPLFASAPVEADVQSNDHIEGRIYLIVLDDVHTDLTRTPRVKAAATRFIETNFGTNDLAAVVYTGTSRRRPGLHQQPAAPHRRDQQVQRTQAAVGHAESHRGRPGRIPATGALEPGDDIDQMDRAFRARSMANSIRKLSEFMAGVRGRRKTMLLIGEGVDFDIYQAVGQLGSTASSVLLDTHDAIAAATRGNVTIYAIDPRGLMNAESDLIEVAGTIGDADGRAIANEMRLSQDSLRVLADATGGFAAVNRNDLNGAFDRIVTENSSYYMLGFYSTNDRRNGRYRKLEVRVSRPGLRVRNRAGYYEARGRAPNQPAASASNAIAPALSEALGSPLPMSGVPMKVFAAPFKGTAPNAAVALALEIDVSTLDFVEGNGTFNEQIEVAYTAVNIQGKVFPGERQTATLTLKPDTYERAKARGFRVLSQASLPPGRYQVRVAAGNKAGKAGSVVYDLEVPDFTKEPLMMSGVAMTSAAAAQAPTIKPKDPLADFLPGPPTAMREFDKGDLLVLFAEFYENARGAAPHMLDFKAELRAEGGRVVQQVSDERSSTELQGSSGGYGFQRAPATRFGGAGTLRHPCGRPSRAQPGRRCQSRHSDQGALNETI